MHLPMHKHSHCERQTFCWARTGRQWGGQTSSGHQGPSCAAAAVGNVRRSAARVAPFQRLVRHYERLPTTSAGLHFAAFAYRILARLNYLHNAWFNKHGVLKHARYANGDARNYGPSVRNSTNYSELSGFWVRADPENTIRSFLPPRADDVRPCWRGIDLEPETGGRLPG